MPVTYRFDPDFGFIWTQCVGPVTFDEVRAHFRELESNPATPPSLDVLLDLSALTTLPESDELRGVVGELRRLEPRIKWGACAIVAVEDATFGISRMFEVFAEQQFTRTHVFRDLSKAHNWLVQGEKSA